MAILDRVGDEIAAFAEPTQTAQLISEYNRQLRTGDDKFLKKMLYFFELEVPASVAAGGFTTGTRTFLFPLVINPTSYTLSEPFTVETTPTLGGGLYVEENGIIQRSLRIQGTTGFKPRPLIASSGSALGVTDVRKSYARSLPAAVIEKISGQRHFQYLQDAVFRTYGDLKRDPATAGETFLRFHIPREGEHWLVVPMEFTLERSRGRNNLYDYSIELLVVDKADASRLVVSEDKTVLDGLRDAASAISTGLKVARGAVQDLTLLTGQLEGLVQNFNVIITNANSIIDAADAYVEGVTDLILSPLTLVTNTTAMIDNALRVAANAEAAADEVAKPYIKLTVQTLVRFYTLQKGLERIGSQSAAFETDAQKQVRGARNSSNVSGLSDAEEEAAESATPPSTMSDLDTGTGYTAGQVESAEGELLPYDARPQYTGARQYSVAQGDTLASLAAAFLGDARLWQEIALVNGLRPPFVNEQASASLDPSDETALNNVLGVGRKILIPNFSQPITAEVDLPVLGVPQTAPADEHLFGVDTKLERDNHGFYDVAIDTEGGSTDVAPAEGLDNLAQGLTVRVHTERGTDQLYKQLGLQRIVGTSLTPVDVEMARFRLSESIAADARVANVRKVTFEPPETGSPDRVIADAEVEPRGMADATNVILPVT